MISCMICKQEFDNMITWKHLQKHNITTSEYKVQYGELVSREFRNLKSVQNSGENNPNFGNALSQESKDIIAKSNAGKLPHNKNKAMSPEQKDMLSAKAILRNIEWRNTDTHPITGTVRSAETKEKIKKSRATQVITSDQARKSIETRKRNGHDLAFFRGQVHSGESRLKISESSKIAAQKKHQTSISEAKERLSEHGYSLLSVDEHIMKIQCLQCNNQFSRTRQYATKSKIFSELCNVCFPKLAGTSNLEKQIADFLSNYVPIETGNRVMLSPKEIDIFIPDYNIAIEFNGLYWHSELYKDQNYHLDKKLKAAENGIHLIHIFEDEWVNSPEIVKSRLLSQLGKIDQKIYARNCTITELDSVSTNQFIKNNHIQGTGRSNVRIGLFYKGQLVSVMTFLHGDISKGVKGWELNRFCSLINVQVVGGASRLFKWFIKNYNPESIISFSDRRWGKDKSVYETLGFKFESFSPPNYWYIEPNITQRFHRYALRKPANSILSERQLRQEQGYLRIYDCGSAKLCWTR